MDSSGKTSFVFLMVLICIDIALQLSCDLYVREQICKFDEQYSITKEYKLNNNSDSMSTNEAIKALDVVKKSASSLLYKIVVTCFVGMFLSFWHIISDPIYKHIFSEAYICREHSKYIDCIKIVGYIVTAVTILIMLSGARDSINKWREISGYFNDILQVIGKISI